MLEKIAKLHNIGKVNISEELVNQTIDNKKDVLKMKQHVEIGYRILSRLPKYFEIAFDVLTQYENFDGSGYPKRLKGTDIPRSEEHTSELQSRPHLVCRLLLEKKKKQIRTSTSERRQISGPYSQGGRR